MIKAEKEKITFNGDLATIMSEYMLVTRSLWELLMEDFPEEYAKKMVRDFVEGSLVTEEQIKEMGEMTAEEFAERMDEILGGEKND